MAAILAIVSLNFNFLVPKNLKAYIQNRFKMAHWFLKKPVLIDLEPRLRNELDLQYSHNFINSSSCLHLPFFRSQAAIVSEKSTVFTFSYRKAEVTKFDLAIKRSWSTKDHHLYKLCRAWVPVLHANFQDHRTSGSGVVFTIYGRGGHLGHETWTIYTNSLFPRRLHMNFGFVWPSGFREDL